MKTITMPDGAPICCCGTVCDPLDYGLYPTAYGIDIGETDEHWTSGVNVHCVPTWPYHGIELTGRWLSITANGNESHPVGEWTGSLTFEVPTTEILADLAFTGRVMGDNEVLSVKLNGTDLGASCTVGEDDSDMKCFHCWVQFLLAESTGLVLGENTIEIKFNNLPWPGTPAGPSPLGWRAHFVCGDTMDDDLGTPAACQ